MLSTTKKQSGSTFVRAMLTTNTPPSFSRSVVCSLCPLLNDVVQLLLLTRFLLLFADQEQANKFFRLSADKETASVAGANYGGCDVFGKSGHTRVDEWEQPSLS